MVWYQCRHCHRFLGTIELLRSHTKSQHPQEYARALEESRRKKGQFDVTTTTGNSDVEKSREAGQEGSSSSSSKEFELLGSPVLSSSSSSRNTDHNSPQEVVKEIECQNKSSRQSTRLSLKSKSVPKLKNGPSSEPSTFSSSSSPSPNSATTPTGQRFKCSKCSRTFGFQSVLNVHFNTMHSENPEKKVCCGICGAKFLWHTQRARHIQKCHQDTKDDGESSKEIPNVNQNEQKIHHDHHHHKSKSSIVTMTTTMEATTKKSLNKDPIIDSHQSTVVATDVEDGLEKLEESPSQNGGPTGGPKYSCRVCGRNFEISQQLAAHFRHSVCTKRSFDCNSCNEKFSRRDQLRKHRAKFHSKKATPVPPATPTPTPSLVTARPKRQRRGRSTVAKSSSSGFEGKGKKEEKDVKILASPKLEMKAVPKSCPGKSEPLLSPSSNKFSRQIFQGRELFVCNRCMAILPDEGTAAEHVRLSHGQSGKIENCDVVMESPKLDRDGAKHKQAISPMTTQNKVKRVMFKCHLCPKVFLSSGDRTLHRLKGHRNLPKKNIQSHPANDRRESKEVASGGPSVVKSNQKQKPMGGPVSSNTQTQSLKTQASTAFKSSPHITCQKIRGRTFIYICNFCGKEFDRPSHAVFHTRTHTNERPYGCEVCQKRFKLAGSLKKHMESCIPAQEAFPIQDFP